jgi:two-component system response regulator FixJ
MMDGMSELEVQARLLELGILLPVVMMTSHGDVQIAVKSLKARAVDFIEKPFTGETLLAAVNAALEKSATARHEDAFHAAKRIATLSTRELEVLRALAAGKSNKIIAYEWKISARTVEVHRARMMRRLGIRQLAEAVRLAVLAQLWRDRANAQRRHWRSRLVLTYARRLPDWCSWI